jgi:hypothetical protein
VRTYRILLVGLVLSTVAVADPMVDTLVKIANTGGPANDPLPIHPRLVIDAGVTAAPADYTDAMTSYGGEHYVVSAKPVVATAGDGKAAWVATDLAFREYCAKPSCDKDPPWALGHMTAVFDAGKLIAWDITKLAKANKPSAFPAITRAVDAPAQAAEKQFEETLGDPAALAKTVSDRKDVVLYGSDPGERFVGGAAVRAQLAKWKLGFKLRDGVQAGATASGSLAFVVANVDAAKPSAKTATPYRLFAVYEKTAAGWQLVVLQFSVRAG